MAGRVPFMGISGTGGSQDPSTASPSSSYEMLPRKSELDYTGNMRLVTRNWSDSLEGDFDQNFHEQLEEQYKCQVDQCLTALKNVKRKKETTFIQVKKTIRDKVDTMMKVVRESFERMHYEGTKKLELKCEEICHVLGRVETLVEEGNKDASLEVNGPDSVNNQTFYDAVSKEKQRIQLQAEELIQSLNKKRESDEQMYMEFREDIQQKVQEGISRIERSLEYQNECQVRAVEEKISQLRRALANLQHLTKFS